MSDNLTHLGSLHAGSGPWGDTTPPGPGKCSTKRTRDSIDQRHDQYCTTGEPLILPGAFLKWYELRRGEQRISGDLILDGRSILTQEVSSGRLAFDHGLGFVVLHHAPPLACLVVGRWHENREIWQTLFIRDLRTGEQFKRMARGGAPTCRVWDIALVRRDRKVMGRFLQSSRDTTGRHS